MHWWRSYLCKRPAIYTGHATLLLLFFLCATQQAQTESVPFAPTQVASLEPTVFEGIDLVYQDQFEEAIRIYDRLIESAPDKPSLYFYRAAAYMTWMSSYRTRAFEEEMSGDLDRCIYLSEVKLNADQQDATLNFYLGAAYGYRAFYKVESHNWVGAYLDGRKGIGNFKAALEKDPELHDVYFGLGSYHYWRSARSKFLRAIAFWMKDLRHDGIEQVRFAAENGRFCTYQAQIGLVNILYDAQQYDAADDACLAISLPNGAETAAHSYIRGRIAVQQQRWEEAEMVFVSLLGRLKNQPFGTSGFQGECHYWIAKSLVYLGDIPGSHQHLDLASQRYATMQKEKELEGVLESAEEIRRRISQLKKLLPADETYITAE